MYSTTPPTNTRLFLDALVAAVLVTVLGLTFSFFIQALVDSVFVLGRKLTLNWLGLGMLLVSLARAGFLGLRSYLFAHLSRRIEAGTMLGRCRVLQGLPLVFFLPILADALCIVIPIAVMLFIDWQLTLESLQWMLVLGAVLWLLSRHVSKESFDVCATSLCYLTTSTSSLALLWFGAHKVLTGSLSIGQLMALHTTLGMIVVPIERLVNAPWKSAVKQKALEESTSSAMYVARIFEN